jgi:hypothetical protein
MLKTVTSVSKGSGESILQWRKMLRDERM